jgi:hypothetical protein
MKTTFRKFFGSTQKLYQKKGILILLIFLCFITFCLNSKVFPQQGSAIQPEEEPEYWERICNQTGQSSNVQIDIEFLTSRQFHYYPGGDLNCSTEVCYVIKFYDNDQFFSIGQASESLLHMDGSYSIENNVLSLVYDVWSEYDDPNEISDSKPYVSTCMLFCDSISLDYELYFLCDPGRDLMFPDIPKGRIREVDGIKVMTMGKAEVLTTGDVELFECPNLNCKKYNYYFYELGDSCENGILVGKNVPKGERIYLIARSLDKSVVVNNEHYYWYYIELLYDLCYRRYWIVGKNINVKDEFINR